MLIIARGRIVASGTLTEIRALLEDRPLTVEIGSPAVRGNWPRCWWPIPRCAASSCVAVAWSFKRATRIRFFTLVNDLIGERAIECHKLHTLDAGADAVFNYLQQGAR